VRRALNAWIRLGFLTYIQLYLVKGAIYLIASYDFFCIQAIVLRNKSTIAMSSQSRL